MTRPSILGNQYANVAHRQPSGPIADAMLALAFEQRTANLIAYANASDGETADRLWDHIITPRLGMDETNE